jgi:hypothetical protein
MNADPAGKRKFLLNRAAFTAQKKPAAPPSMTIIFFIHHSKV